MTTIQIIRTGDAHAGLLAHLVIADVDGKPPVAYWRRRPRDVTGVAQHTSSYRDNNGGTCIEVGTAGPAVAVRDKRTRPIPSWPSPATTWKAFTSQLKTTAC